MADLEYVDPALDESLFDPDEIFVEDKEENDTLVSSRTFSGSRYEDIKSCLAVLEQAGVKQFESSWSGGGDSGDVQDVMTYPQIPDVEDAAEELAYILCDFLPAGMENNEGGSGEFFVDFESRRIRGQWRDHLGSHELTAPELELPLLTFETEHMFSDSWVQLLESEIECPVDGDDLGECVEDLEHDISDVSKEELRKYLAAYASTSDNEGWLSGSSYAQLYVSYFRAPGTRGTEISVSLSVDSDETGDEESAEVNF